MSFSENMHFKRSSRIIVLTAVLVIFGSAVNARNLSSIRGATTLFVNASAIGDQQQKKVPTKYQKLSRSVGLLINSRGAFCTAFCLRKNVIGTAAHCVEFKDAGFTPNSLRFRLPGSGRTSPVSGGNSQAKRLNTFIGSIRNERHHDWALVRLAKPICAGLDLDTANLSIDQLRDVRTEVVGIFYQLVSNRPRLRFSECDVGRHTGTMPLNPDIPPYKDDIVLHNCDVKQGSSGSPLIWVNGDEPRVVALQSGFHTIFERNYAHIAVHIRTVLPYLGLIENGKSKMSPNLTKQIQKLLKATGDYRSGIDGIYGLGTRQAIIDYTRRHSLPIMSDRPIGELVPIMEKYQTPAPNSDLLKTLEAHINSPIEAYRHKAIAVNFKRDGWASGSAIRQEDAKDEAVKLCVGQLKRKKTLGPSKDRCDLYAVDGEIVLNKADPNGETNAKILEKFDDSKSKIRVQLAEYRNRRGVDYKAAAIGDDGDRLMSCENQSSARAAIECAIKTCNASASNCEIFAIGDKAVYGMDKGDLAILNAYYEAVVGTK